MIVSCKYCRSKVGGLYAGGRCVTVPWSVIRVLKKPVNGSVKTKVCDNRRERSYIIRRLRTDPFYCQSNECSERKAHFDKE